MYYFYGNKKSGFWWANDAKGVGVCFSPQELIEHIDKIIWVRTDDSGDFYWPHISGGDKVDPIPLNHEDDIDPLDDQKRRLGFTVGA